MVVVVGGEEDMVSEEREGREKRGGRLSRNWRL